MHFSLEIERLGESKRLIEEQESNLLTVHKFLTSTSSQV